jgi:hypothetical protein
MTACSGSNITIYPIYNNTVIAFNNSGVVLKDRSHSDLIDLGIMAHQSKNPNLLKLFQNLPDLATLQLMKMRLIEQQVMKK